MKHAYALRNRPPGYAHCPEGWAWIESPPGYRIPGVPTTWKHTFGVVGYDRKLSDEELQKWEMEYIGPHYSKEALWGKHFDHVEVTRSSDEIKVSIVWKGVDRPKVDSWILRPRNKRLAVRLQMALENPTTYEQIATKVDANGFTFVLARVPLFGKTLNADLKRLGY